jgi:ABC-type histidine transport system ATPase subunit
MDNNSYFASFELYANPVVFSSWTKRPVGMKALAAFLAVPSREYKTQLTLRSVDSETDKLMQRVIRTHFRDQTIIAIAHKLDTVLDYDKIVFLEQGRVVEFDTPKALLSSEGSTFKAMFDSFRHSSE